MSNEKLSNEAQNPASCQTAVSGSWFDFYGSKNEKRNIVYPKIDENVEFETTNGLTLKGEFANKHSVGVFWAKMKLTGISDVIGSNQNKNT